jgi:hypothetical protein
MGMLDAVGTGSDTMDMVMTLRGGGGNCCWLLRLRGRKIDMKRASGGNVGWGLGEHVGTYNVDWMGMPLPGRQPCVFQEDMLSFDQQSPGSAFCESTACLFTVLRQVTADPRQCVRKMGGRK